jgi:hypothetical protein
MVLCGAFISKGKNEPTGGGTPLFLTNKVVVSLELWQSSTPLYALTSKPPSPRGSGLVHSYL